jgi:hypothetical protein
MPKKVEEHDQEEDFEDDLAEEKEAQKDAMKEWFYERYEDPANSTPYESAEGGYLYIWGGPYEASDVLFNEFSGKYPDKVIEELAEELTNECWEWAPTSQMIDVEIYDEMANDDSHHSTFMEAIGQINELLTLHADGQYAQLVYKLLYVHVITALETFLFEAFVYGIKSDDKYFKKLVENSKDYSDKKICLQDIFKEFAKLEETVKSDLVDIVWHNIAKVKKYYAFTFGIEFDQDSFKSLNKAISIRHDIVHRNGKDKDGEGIALTVDTITSLISVSEAFASDIDKQLQSLFQEST